MSRRNIIFWLVVAICAICLIRFTRVAPQQPTYNYEELIHDIDSLNNELSILKLQKDSLHTVIDSSKVRVDVIDNWYEKKLIDITNQSIADDVVFFTEYLSKANE